jgi:predicted Zn-dependent protease
MKPSHFAFWAVTALAPFIQVPAGAASFDFGRAFDAAKGVAAATKDVDEKDEIEIGRELAGRILGVQPLVNDPELQAYVNRVGRWIAAQSERPDLPWRFGVIDHPVVNAFATPGGFVLISRGLYEILDTEAQLAGVLGHEIGHIVRRHHITVMQQQGLLAVGAKIFQAEVGKKNAIVNRAIGTGATLIARGLDKEAEYEADRLGVILAARAGYSPYGLVEVLHKLAARKPDEAGLKILFKTHPQPRDRLTSLGEALEPRIAALPAGQEPAIRQVSADVAPAPAPAPARGAKRKPASADCCAAAQPAQQAQPESAPTTRPGRRGGFGIDPAAIFGK